MEELKGHKKIRVSFVNEGAMVAGFSGYIREHLTGATFVDMTDEIDEIKAIKSPEEVECIKYSAYVHDEARKACFEAIKPGVRKIKIDPEIRLAMTAAVRKFLHENPSHFDPRDYLKPARAAAKAICKERYLQFGCEGQGSRIQPVPLQTVAHRYQTGELSQHVH